MNLIKSITVPAVLLGIMLLFAPAIMAETGKATEFPEDIISRLQSKYDNMTSLSFSFKQRSQGEMSGRPKTGSGTAYFHKQDTTSRMRWNYAEPDQQVLISDGKTFSMYFAQLQQMIISPAEQLDNDLTYSFFSGRAKIADTFHILPPDPEYIQEQVNEGQPKPLKLVPREPQSQMQSIHLWVTEDSLIRRIEIRDHFDTITLLNLSNIEVNFLDDKPAAQVDSLFSFTPPEGTEIIRQ